MDKVIKQYDLGTKVRIERGEIDLIVDHEGGQRARVKSSSYLDELRNRKHVNNDQYHAGNKFYHDWYYGVQTRDGCGIAAYEMRVPIQGMKTAEYTEFQMVCWDKYHKAVKSLEGLGVHIVKGVCCYNFPLKEIENKLGLPRKFGVTRLKESLDTLSIHYGIVQEKA